MEDLQLKEERGTEFAREAAQTRRLPWVLAAVLAPLAAWFAWEAYGPDEIGNPVATSILAFEKQNRLTVFSAQLAPVVESEDSRFFDLVQSRQVAVIPANVAYTLDLSEVDAGRVDWDETTQTLDIRLPDVEIGAPNLDEASARYLREGIWISREAQDELTRDNTLLAERQAMEQARSPVLMDLARQAAREAVQQNLAIPLQVAGFGDVTVQVAFDGIGTPPAE
jgi:hypothetical protein